MKYLLMINKTINLLHKCVFIDFGKMAYYHECKKHGPDKKTFTSYTASGDMADAEVAYFCDNFLSCSDALHPTTQQYFVLYCIQF